jgi:hypothetical protein
MSERRVAACYAQGVSLQVSQPICVAADSARHKNTKLTDKALDCTQLRKQIHSLWCIAESVMSNEFV